MGAGLLEQAGIAGILLVLVVREILQWVGKHPATTNSDTTCPIISRKVDRIHDVVTRPAPDGMPLIYRHPEISTLLRSLVETQATQTAILRDMQKVLDRIDHDRRHVPRSQ